MDTQTTSSLVSSPVVSSPVRRGSYGELSTSDIEKLMQHAPADRLINTPPRRRCTPLELKMGVQRAAEWKANKRAEMEQDEEEEDI